MAPSVVPSQSIVPARVGSRPLIALTIVLFPAPLEPISATRRPLSMVRSMPRMTLALPYPGGDALQDEAAHDAALPR
ncbi:hypothetical protein BTHI11S_01422 [Bosea thiooxidans]